MNCVAGIQAGQRSPPDRHDSLQCASKSMGGKNRAPDPRVHLYHNDMSVLRRCGDGESVKSFDTLVPDDAPGAMALWPWHVTPAADPPSGALPRRICFVSS